MTTLLEVSGLAKRYGDTAIFQHVDLRVARGEFVAILGESGVGKSTLLNCIAGLDTVASGHVSIDGTDIVTLGEAQQALFRRAHLGFVFQAFHVLPHLSVAHNVGLPLLLQGRPDDVRVQAVLAAVGLEGLDDRLPQTLSGGQLQRVAIARALVHRPQLILADEPTGNLDTRSTAELLGLFARLHRQGRTVILITHEAEVAAHARRVIRVMDGEITADERQAAPA